MLTNGGASMNLIPRAMCIKLGKDETNLMQTNMVVTYVERETQEKLRGLNCVLF